MAQSRAPGRHSAAAAGVGAKRADRREAKCRWNTPRTAVLVGGDSTK
jgi:hypothetical protein